MSPRTGCGSTSLSLHRRCRVAAKIDQNRRPTLTKIRCVAGAGHLHRVVSGQRSGCTVRPNSSEPNEASPPHCLPGYFMRRVEPVVGSLLDAATANGKTRPDVNATELPHAVALLCQPVPGEDLAYNQRVVAILRWTAVRHRQGFLVETREVVRCRRPQRGEATAWLAAG